MWDKKCVMVNIEDSVINCINVFVTSCKVKDRFILSTLKV